MKDRERLVQMLEFDLEDLPILQRNASDPIQDRGGDCTAVLGDTYQGIGILEYLLNQDVASFRRNLRESALIQLQLFERFTAGGLPDGSYVTMLAYKELLDSLAAGDFDLARKLAGFMGGRPELEQYFDHPFDIAMGYVLRSFVLNDESSSRTYLEHFKRICEERDHRDFQGYVEVFSALLARDVAAIDRGFRTLVKGHERQSREGGMFANLLDRYLCVWGIGMANLCRWRGLAVAATPPLIPANLLVG